MTTWAERMHRRAATIGTVVTSCAHSGPYPKRLEKVKFGIPLDQVCRNDIPGPLLVVILKLNKEGPYKKDVFRAPGHQGNMKKLIHFLQNGRLVNIENFSVYTIASVLKKFLRKIPSGVFGVEGEKKLFHVIEMDDIERQRDEIHSLITSMPMTSQRLLVLLFGTFRMIAMQAESNHSGMTSEALGVSVAPSFFQSCVSGGRNAKMEDVARFKVATKITKFFIDNFGVINLFGRENYEYYARITGRILKVEEDWIFSFRYPSDSVVSRSQEESQSTPALVHSADDSCLHESSARLSISLGENGIYHSGNISKNGQSSSLQSTGNGGSCQASDQHLTLEELRVINRYAESTKSLSYLPQVHERQTARMRTRSEWFLSPAPQPREDVLMLESSHVLSSTQCLSNSSAKVNVDVRGSPNKESTKVVRRSSSKRKNKENGGNNGPTPRKVTDQDCTQTDIKAFHVTMAYKPRI